MWGWFKKKSAPQASELHAFAEKWLGPQAMAVAIAQTVRAYADSVKAGRLTYPAHRRKLGAGGASVVEIWRDLRLEALHQLFDFGRSDPFLLSDPRRQLEVLTCFLEEQSHLEMPQPRGEVVPDTIQAMWQVYVYLGKVGSEVADHETDRATLKLARRSILDHLTAQAQTLQSQWETFEHAVRSGAERIPEKPRTLIEVLYEDVTIKAKSVALSSRFGPDYKAGITWMENWVSKSGHDTADVRATTARLMAAKDPDEFV